MNPEIKARASGPREVPASVRERYEQIKASGGRPYYYTNKHGQVGVMNTANIGRHKAPRATAQVTNAALRARILSLEMELAEARERIDTLRTVNETLAKAAGRHDFTMDFPK